MDQDKTVIEIRMAVADDAAAIAFVLSESFVEYKPFYTDQGFTATTPTIDQIRNRMSEGPAMGGFA